LRTLSEISPAAPFPGVTRKTTSVCTNGINGSADWRGEVAVFARLCPGTNSWPEHCHDRRVDTDVVSRPVWYLLTAVGSLILASGEQLRGGEDPSPDKSRYTLFRPTPRNLMREMSTDRPDKIESPRTVDAGHFQFEMDAVSYVRDRDDPHTDAWSVAPVNLKLGLLNNVDLQLVVEPWNHLRIADSATGEEEVQSGFGDLSSRVKVNLWGNDHGKSALAVMPFVVFPTASDNLGAAGFEGGLIFPFALDLPAGWGLSMMTEVDFMRDDSGRSYHQAFVNCIGLNHDIVGDLDGYVEFFSEVSTETDSHWIGTVDVGFTYRVTGDIQLDCGVNVGVTASADDVNPFLGLSWRF
jgi:hypothetical protein